MTIFSLQREEHDVDRFGDNAIEQEVNNVAIGVILTLAAMIGIWGVACLLSGVVGSDGVVALVQSWFSAVNGG